jgi:hypothetical protein
LSAKRVARQLQIILQACADEKIGDAGDGEAAGDEVAQRAR